MIKKLDVYWWTCDSIHRRMLTQLSTESHDGSESFYLHLQRRLFSQRYLQLTPFWDVYEYDQD